MQRASGILLHPTALPNSLPVGDLGVEAFSFVDFLAKSGQSIWQVLPLGPTGYGHSPYNALSAFAGNPVLIDLAQLVAVGDLDSDLLKTSTARRAIHDFDQVHAIKEKLLYESAKVFFAKPSTDRHKRYEHFCNQHAAWLEDFSLFMALREHFEKKQWSSWPSAVREREDDALLKWRDKLDARCQLFKYQQFIFTEQWQRLKAYANGNGIRIFGDIPIFVAYDSADVWSNQKLFQLDAHGKAKAVAGVPPDYFSKTGQRWGNPLYRWEEHLADDFGWWLQRFNHQLHTCDMVRIDHFRGFQASWSIPAEEKTAVKGHWENVPGRELFTRLQEQNPELPIIAEDLGIITPEVEQLRDDFGFPGMKILQFAFDSGQDNPYLPANHTDNSVVYTGTHDNDTTLGWWQGLSKTQKDPVRMELGTNRPDMPWEMIRLAMSSIAALCIIPCQDILGLDSKARFNTPGKSTGNWQWQMQPGALTDKLASELLSITRKYHRALHR